MFMDTKDVVQVRKETMMPFSNIIPGEFVVCLTKGLFTNKERERERWVSGQHKQ